MQHRIGKAVQQGKKAFSSLPQSYEYPGGSTISSSPVRESREERKRHAVEVIGLMQAKNQSHLAEVDQMLHWHRQHTNSFGSKES